MMTLCSTGRGRIACGLGGLAIAVLALGCLWAFSPAVTAGDGPPAKKDARLPDCPPPSTPVPLPPVVPLPAAPTPPAPLPPASPAVADTLPPPKPVSEPLPPKAAPEPPAPKHGELDLPPMPKVPPVAPKEPPPPPPVPTGLKEPSPVPPVATAPSDGQDIKQLLARLTEIKAERAKLDERERQTIQAVKRKYQEQKHALEQLERELRQLGIDCREETASHSE